MSQDFATADLYDRFGERLAVAEPIFRDFGGRAVFSGPIETIKAFEDNSLVRNALEEPGEGRVLVVDGGGSLRCALVGDQLARLGQKNGWNGIVVWGCVRDSAVLRTIPIGIKALAANPTKSVKRNEGRRGLAVRFAGVEFRSGQFVYADEDGVVVSPARLALD